MPARTPTPDGQSSGAPRGRRDRARTGGMIVLAVVITLFAVLNLDTVRVHWIFGTSEAPLTIVIVISLLVGIVFTYVADRRNRRN